MLATKSGKTNMYTKKNPTTSTVIDIVTMLLSSIGTFIVKQQTEKIVPNIPIPFIGQIPLKKITSYAGTIGTTLIASNLAPGNTGKFIMIGGLGGIILQELLSPGTAPGTAPGTNIFTQIGQEIADSPTANAIYSYIERTTAEGEYMSERERNIFNNSWIFHGDTRQFVSWLRERGYELPIHKQDVIASYRFEDILSGKYSLQVGRVLNLNSEQVITLARQFTGTVGTNIAQSTLYSQEYAVER